jgi:hypothetical protein
MFAFLTPVAARFSPTLPELAVPENYNSTLFPFR